MFKRNAIILAAGIGSRLRPLTDNFPKCMVKVNNQTLISRLISQLNSLKSIDQIIVVAGYKYDILIEHIENLGFENIMYVKNEFYNSTNNMFSLNLAFKHSMCDSIVINADCIYEDSIINKLEYINNSVILFDSTHRNLESMKIQIHEDIIIDMSKNIELNHSFSSIDLYYFKKEHLDILKTIICKYLNHGDNNLWSEVAIKDLIQSQLGLIGHLDIKGQKWYEIDDLSDLNSANKLFS
jgi:choline kinase